MKRANKIYGYKNGKRVYIVSVFKQVKHGLFVKETTDSFDSEQDADAFIKSCGVKESNVRESTLH